MLTQSSSHVVKSVLGAAGDQPVPREWSVQRPWDERPAVVSSVLAMPDAPGSSAQHAATRQKGVSNPRSTRQRHAPSPLGRREVHDSGGHSQGHDDTVLSGAAPLSPLPPSSCTRSHARQTTDHLKPAASPAAHPAADGGAGQHRAPVQQTAHHRQRAAAAEEMFEDGRAMPGQRGSCTSGSVAASAVEPEVLELLQMAVRRLRGLRLCEDGHEEARLTHLVLGAPRRTLKVSLEPLAGIKKVCCCSLLCTCAEQRPSGMPAESRLPPPTSVTGDNIATSELHSASANVHRTPWREHMT